MEEHNSMNDSDTEERSSSMFNKRTPEQLRCATMQDVRTLLKSVVLALVVFAQTTSPEQANEHPAAVFFMPGADKQFRLTSPDACDSVGDDHDVVQ